MFEFIFFIKKSENSNFSRVILIEFSFIQSGLQFI